MRYCTTVWSTLEQRSPIALLAAGGLFMLLAVASGVETATGTAIDVPLPVVFISLLLVFAGLLGLYPGLADRGSTLATMGVGILTATAGVIVPTLGVTALPNVVTVGQTTAMVLVLTIAVGAVLTITAFGLASLRTGAYSRRVGWFLLVASAAMALMVTAMLRYGHETPGWISLIANGLVGTALGTSGYTLRTGAVPTTNRESTGDVVTS